MLTDVWSRTHTAACRIPETWFRFLVGRHRRCLNEALVCAHASSFVAWLLSCLCCHYAGCFVPVKEIGCEDRLWGDLWCVTDVVTCCQALMYRCVCVCGEGGAEHTTLLMYRRVHSIPRSDLLSGTHVQMCVCVCGEGGGRTHNTTDVQTCTLHST